MKISVAATISINKTLEVDDKFKRLIDYDNSVEYQDLEDELIDILYRDPAFSRADINSVFDEETDLIMYEN